MKKSRKTRKPPVQKSHPVRKAGKKTFLKRKTRVKPKIKSKSKTSVKTKTNKSKIKSSATRKLKSKSKTKVKSIPSSNLNPLPCTMLHPKNITPDLEFETTDEIQDLTHFVGQKRATEAVTFGVGIKAPGHNLYAMGPSGVGKRTIVQSILESEAIKNPTPSDWCYVNNFKDNKKPVALELPPGGAQELKNEMQNLIAELVNAIPVIFESEEYKSRIRKIVDEFNEKQDSIIKEIEEQAKKSGLLIFFYPQNFVVFAQDKNNEIITEEKFAKLSKEERDEKQALINDFNKKVPDFLKKIPVLLSKRKEQEKQINKEFTLLVVGFHMTKLKDKYENMPKVLEYFNAVQEDVIENVADFLKKEMEPASPLAQLGFDSKQLYSRYQVNVMVDHSNSETAPVIYEESPTYSNLISRIEHIAVFGTLTTDFNMVRPGSLHKANGGYLIVDVLKLLKNPFAWVGLKHALLTGKITIEPPERLFGMLTTITLEPEPIPLNLKVVLLGDRQLFIMLSEYDDDFADLFKVVVDFDEKIDRKPKNIKLYAKLVATLVRKNNLKPFNRDAVLAIIDHGMRLSEDSDKLSIHMRNIDDIIRESNYYAEKADNPIVDKNNVRQAIESKIYRLDRFKTHIYEEIQRNVLMIETAGKIVGQLNALTVIQLTRYSFGLPTRLTAKIRIGEGRIIDIQKEIHLGGPIHSKGVLILSGYLATHYSSDQPFALTASLVFEQTYGFVEGDSASLAELCVLISAIANVPLKQSIAITGSVNQFGMSQAVGGVNEKIEGFFDICKERKLTGEQGVIIPEGNLKSLILREDVVLACKNKKFHIYAVKNVDEAITILTGLKAGERNKKTHKFPKGSVNALVQKHLREFAKKRIITPKMIRGGKKK